MKSEIETRAKFDYARYALTWEDADLLLEALALKEGDTVLSIAAAGDNAFALLSKPAHKIYAIDLNPVQLYYCQLKAAAYKALDYDDFIRFCGLVSRLKSAKRVTLYQQKLRPLLEAETQIYWDNNIALIEQGFVHFGKFERYFGYFRKTVLPLAHSKKDIDALLTKKTKEERISFYQKVWDNRRWRAIFNIFFSKFVMGRLGRDKEFFKYVKTDVAANILKRTKHALTELDCSENPYLHYILRGRFDVEKAMPYAFRRENFAAIKANIDRIEFLKLSIEEFAAEYDVKINAFNLSDIFEYMSPENMESLYERLLEVAADDARFAYWNMLAERSASEALCQQYHLRTDEEKNHSYLKQDKAFFYSKFYLDKLV